VNAHDEVDEKVPYEETEVGFAVGELEEGEGGKGEGVEDGIAVVVASCGAFWSTGRWQGGGSKLVVGDDARL
jgi:hypothetical protein